MIDFDVAKEAIIEHTQTITATQILPLRHASSCVLAKSVRASQNFPSFANSAMDGYAVAFEDITKYNQLTCVAEIHAGDSASVQCQTGECARIMTGAKLPGGTDTVVMQEVAQQRGSQVSFDALPVKVGEYVRQPGEDIKLGETVFKPGRKLGPAELAVLAALGEHNVTVYRKPKVAVFSTGNELVEPGDACELGKIYDANRYALISAIEGLGAEVFDLGILPDDQTIIRQELAAIATQVDMIITSGGVSVGEADFVKKVLEDIGTLKFWKVAIKPGKPLAFGTIGEALFFGLPGNPVSSQVTFDLFVRPSLQKLAGQTIKPPLVIKAKISESLTKAPGRMEFKRAIIDKDIDGSVSVTPTGSQCSGAISSMAKANAYIVLPKDSTGIDAGQWVDVWPLA